MNIFKYEVEDGLQEQVAKASSLAYTLAIVEKEISQEAIVKAIAKANPNQIDLFYFESILASAGWNKNDDVFDVLELWMARNTAVDKPVNYMHNEKEIIGHMTSSIVIHDSNVLPDSLTAEELPTTIDIAVGSVLYKFWEDPQQKEKVGKLIAEIKDGLWCVSMECIFPHFDYAVITPEGQQKVIARNDETSFLTKHLRLFGGKGEYKGYRVGRLLRNFTFSGKGIVSNPANPRSNITGCSDDKEVTNFSSQSSLDINELKENTLMADEKTILQAATLKISDAVVNKEAYDAVVEELKALKSTAAEYAKKEMETLSSQTKTLATQIEAQKEIVSQKEVALSAAAEEIKGLKAELSTVKAELEQGKLDAVKATRLSKLLAKKVDEVKAKSLVEKFATLAEETFNDILDAIPVAEAKKEEDDKKVECAKKDEEEKMEKEKCADKAAAELKKAESTDAPLVIPNEEKAGELVSKASSWFKSGVDSVIPQKKNK